MGLVTSPIELSAGQWLGRYELVYPVARGGMAQVWLAKLHGQHGFEKLVALKTILPAFAEDQRFRRMFVAEAKISARIEHANVAHIWDLGDHHGVLYLAVEWVDGESLQQLEHAAQRKAGALPIPILLRVMADVCAGLHAAHELRDAHGELLHVVHRDVSPQNVLISREGVVKLIDFGVVKARRRGIEDTTIGTIKGKLPYMAPEQALGRALDRRADIWAVGASLYRLLAHRPLFRSSGPLATFKRLISPAPPDPLPSSVPAALASIVFKALAFEPAQRYATAAELGTALEALLQEPNHATSRDVAACMTRYLGGALAARRQALDRALLACEPGETTQIDARQLLREVARAKELGAVAPLPLALAPARSARRAASLAEPASVERLPVHDEPTRLRGGPPVSLPRASRTRRARRAVAASGLLALGSSVVWAVFSSAGGHPSNGPVSAAPSRAALPGRPTADGAPPMLAQAGSRPAPPPAPASPSERAPPLRLEALPVLSNTTGATKPSVPVKPRSSAPKRATKYGGLSVSPKEVRPRATGSPSPANSRNVEPEVIDDGF